MLERRGNIVLATYRLVTVHVAEWVGLSASIMDTYIHEHVCHLQDCPSGHDFRDEQCKSRDATWKALDEGIVFF